MVTRSKNLRQHAEAMATASRADVANMSSEEVQRLVHELQVHQIELEMQNEELRAAQMELANSRDRYSDLYEHAPIGYVTQDKHGRILEANLTAATLLGVKRKVLLDARLEQFAAPDSLNDCYLHRRRVLSSGGKQVCSTQIERSDGSKLFVRLESTSVGDAGGPCIRTAIIDITDLQAAQRELHLLNEELELRVDARTSELRQRTDQLAQHSIELEASKDRFDLAIRGFANGIWDWPDIEQDNQWWSRRFYELLGYEPGEIEASFSVFKRLLHPDDRGRVIAAAKAHWEDDIRYDIEYRLRTKFGKYRWFRVRADVLRDHHGRPKRMSGCLDDIQDRKIAEQDRAKAVEALHQSESLFRAAFEDAAIGVSLQEPDGTCIRVNEALTRMTGYSNEELRGRNWREMIYPDDRCDASAESEWACIEQEARFIRNDGKYVWVRTSASVVCGKQGEPRFRIVHVQDISQRKEAEDERDRFFETSNDVLAILNIATSMVKRVNRAATALLGYSHEELLSTPYLQLIHPDDREEVIAEQKRWAAGEPREASQLRLRHKNGNYRWFSYSTPAMAEDDATVFMIARDVTEQKRAVEELRHNAEMLRLAVEVSGTDVMEHDHDLNVVNVLASNAKIFDWKPGQTVPVDQVFPLIHPDDRENVLAGIQRSHSPDGDGSFLSEHRIIRPDGATRWLRYRSQTYFHGTKRDRRPVRTIVTAVNLTEQKAIELQLRKERDFSKSVANTAKTILLVLDRDGRILNFNPYFSQIVGYELSEVVGDDWFERFAPPMNRERGRANFQQLLAGIDTSCKVTTILTKAGHEREIEWYDAPLSDADGELMGLLCTGKDVTERLLLEREVLEIAGEEQRRIGHDIHDGLCQELTGLGLLAQGLANLSSPNSDSPQKADSWQQFHKMALDLSVGIGRTTGFARALSHGLVPVDVDKQGLMSALRELVESTNKLERLRCKFEAKTPVDISDNYAATHLYRIAQESVSNALRHSGATEIVVAVCDGDGSITLRISDNGQGLPEANVESGGGHMGLRTMKYRANLVGASLRIESTSGSGTTVTCRWTPITESTTGNERGYDHE